MNRGSETMNRQMSSMSKMTVKQSRKGWCQELFLGCEAKSKFKYLTEDKQEFATSLEDSDCLLRICCAPIRPFTMEVKEVESEAEILTMHRPCACQVGACKCCCHQSMTFKSGEDKIGKIEEQYFYCVPVFKIYDHKGDFIYKVHPPTCCGGCCVNCFTEGNPCGKGCCKVPFHIFKSSQDETDGDAPYAGKIVKVPKSLAAELFTDAEAFDISFPEDASNEQKAMIMRTAIFLNANFFEGQERRERSADTA